MTLPSRTTIEDVSALNGYFASKPTGATIKDAKTALGIKRCDTRKLSGMKSMGFLIEGDDGRIKATDEARAFARADSKQQALYFGKILRTLLPHKAILERVAHRGEETLSASDVAAVWHEAFPEESGRHEKTLNEQAICFFNIAQAAGLGSLIVGRKGAPTRFAFDLAKVRELILDSSASVPLDNLDTRSVREVVGEEIPLPDAVLADRTINSEDAGREKLGQAIFIAHGKEEKPLNQLKSILDEFKVPYKVCVDEPSLGRPISEKVRQTMQGCNCAIIIFSADEEFTTPDGDTVWRPSENVVHELGAAGYLYEKIVIMKEDKVSLPTNFRDICYISFKKDQLAAEGIKVLKELIGFGIVKMTT